jgi:hypothetical protein
MDDCAQADLHTPMPASYVGRQEWAAAMARAHFKPTRCPSCNTLAVWLGLGAPVPPAVYEGGCLNQGR